MYGCTPPNTPLDGFGPVDFPFIIFEIFSIKVLLTKLDFDSPRVFKAC
jgi:hypothetical protein